MPTPRTSALVAAVLALFACGCGHEGTYTCIQYEAEVGETCGLEMDCAEGASCVAGVCEVNGGSGAVCGAGRGCAPGYECSLGTCVGPNAPEGDRCTPGLVAACAAGLICLGGVQSQRCVLPVGVDESCTYDGQCPAGFACSETAAGGTDRRCALAPELGEGCEVSCAAGLVCVSDEDDLRLCVPTPESEGDLCSADADCPSGAHCARETWDGVLTCTADLELGEACSGDRCTPACRPRFICSSRRICQPVLGEAERCDAGRGVCQEGLFCQASMEGGGSFCLPAVPEGASCLDGQACGLGAYCDRDRAGPSWPTSFSLAPTR